jgi:hypothetical protein
LSVRRPDDGEMPKHVAFPLNVNNKEFGCVGLGIVQYKYFLLFIFLKQLNIDCLKNIMYHIISQKGVPSMFSVKQFIVVFTHTRTIRQTFNFVSCKSLKAI